MIQRRKKETDIDLLQSVFYSPLHFEEHWEKIEYRDIVEYIRQWV